MAKPTIKETTESIIINLVSQHYITILIFFAGVAKTTIIQTTEKNNYQHNISTPYHYTYVLYSDMVKTTIQETNANIHDTVLSTQCKKS